MKLFFLIFSTIFLSLFIYGLKSEKAQDSLNSIAKNLNDSAFSIAIRSQDYTKAIDLLNQALKIDSNYFRALDNKLSCEFGLKKYDEALGTLKKIMKLKPEIPEYSVTTGLIYFLKGDTISSEKYFNEAAIKYNRILDTMSTYNNYYDNVLMNKAINLIFNDQQQLANNILKSLYGKAKNDIEKEMYAEYINKSKQEIINSIFNGNQNSVSDTSVSVPSLELDTVNFSTKKDIKNYKFKSGFYLLKNAYIDSQGFNLQNTNEYYYVAKNISMPLVNIDSVFKVFDKHDKFFVLNIYFNKTGVKELNDFTMKCINQKIGLSINNKLLIAALDIGQIENGKMTLSGKFTENDIANMKLQIENTIKGFKKE